MFKPTVKQVRTPPRLENAQVTYKNSEVCVLSEAVMKTVHFQSNISFVFSEDLLFSSKITSANANTSDSAIV